MFRISLILLSILFNVVGEVYLKYSINILDVSLNYATAVSYLLNTHILLSISCIVLSCLNDLFVNSRTG